CWRKAVRRWRAAVRREVLLQLPALPEAPRHWRTGRPDFYEGTAPRSPARGLVLMPMDAARRAARRPGCQTDVGPRGLPRAPRPKAEHRRARVERLPLRLFR